MLNVRLEASLAQMVEHLPCSKYTMYMNTTLAAEGTGVDTQRRQTFSSISKVLEKVLHGRYDGFIGYGGEGVCL